MAYGSDKAEGNWSSIPILLLWMIKDKLDIFDDMNVNAVCHDWRAASSCYPKKQSVGDRMPWIMQVWGDIGSTSREFISIANNKRFTLDIPEFSDAQLLFSKQGWFLMRRRNFSDPKEKMPDSLYLLNPFTKFKITMPVVGDSQRYTGSFSTHDGYPERVVLQKTVNVNQFTFKIASPGDVVWSDHTYVEQQKQSFGRGDLIIIGEQIYFYDFTGKLIIYNISKHIWRELVAPTEEVGQRYVAEHEGNIVKLLVRGYDFRMQCFFIYNDTTTSWERLNNEKLMDTNWYISRVHNTIIVKGNGLKVHALRPWNDRSFLGRHLFCDYDVVSHDFTDRGTEILNLPHRLCSPARWVDIG